MGPGYNVGTFYPMGDQIPALTSVNRGAVLYLVGMADCPQRAAGLGRQVLRTERGDSPDPPRWPRRTGLTLKFTANPQDSLLPLPAPGGLPGP